MNEKDFEKCKNDCMVKDCILFEHYRSLLDEDIVNETLGYATREIYELALENKNSKRRKKSISKVKKLLEKENASEFLYLDRKNYILCTATHAAWHFRYAWKGKNKRKLGDWLKLQDINTGILACYLSKKIGCSALIQLYTAWLDPNFYREAFLRQKLRDILKSGDIKFILDLHGLSKERAADFDIIDMLGLALLPFNALEIRNSLKNRLKSAGYDVGVNRYFNGGLNLQFQHTIVKEVSQEFGIPCIELEVGRKFREIGDRLFDEEVIEILENWLKNDVKRIIDEL